MCVNLPCLDATKPPCNKGSLGLRGDNLHQMRSAGCTDSPQLQSLDIKLPNNLAAVNRQGQHTLPRQTYAAPTLHWHQLPSAPFLASSALDGAKHTFANGCCNKQGLGSGRGRVLIGRFG